MFLKVRNFVFLGGEKVYTEIEKLFAVSDVSKFEAANLLGMTYNTFLLKLKGKYKFTLDESFGLKRILKTDLPLEKLFSFTA